MQRVGEVVSVVGVCNVEGDGEESVRREGRVCNAR